MALVLVVDDDPDILDLVSDALRRDGHTTILATDGPAALTAARRQVPDIIVLDVMLPGLSGLQVCDALRADLTTAAIPVLMLTALGGELDIEGAFGVGADDYLTKPFQLDELRSRVTALLATEPVAGAVDAPRASVDHDGPSRAALDQLTSRAGVILLRGLADGPRTGDELRAMAAPPDERILEDALLLFQRDGWIRRDGARYELTEVGGQVARRLREVLTLIERTVPATILARHRFQRT